MSVPEFTLQLGEMLRQKQFRKITQSLLLVHANAHLAAKYQRALEATQRNIEMLRQLNPELIMADAKRRAGYMIILFALPAIYGIDFILLSSVTEYFARKVYSDQLMVSVARLVIPASILCIELMLAHQRAFAHENAAEYGTGKTSRVWVFFSLLLLCVLPAMIVATHIVSMPARMAESLEMVNILQMVGLVALAVVMHGVVLYGGQLGVEAKAYLYLKLRLLGLNLKIGRSNNRYQKAAAAGTEAYILHERTVQEYRSLYPHSMISTGPFDLLTQQLLQEWLGGEVIDLRKVADRANWESRGDVREDS